MKRILEEMLKSGMPVNWTTILVGWNGPGKFPRQISREEFASYTIQRMGNSSHQQIEVNRAIRALAASEPGNKETETRKWRLYLLKDAMNNLAEDEIDGLYQLTDFWEKFDYPSDSPHAIQGDDGLVPEDYYTKENYQSLVKRHQEWLKEEENALRYMG